MKAPLVITQRVEPHSATSLPIGTILRLLQSANGRQSLRYKIAQRIHRTKPITHFNEAVNPDLGVIYVAIPKTGSTTIRNQVSPLPHLDRHYLSREAHLDLIQIRQGLSFFAQYQALGSNISFPATVASTRDLERGAQEFFDTAFKFSVVRNPWARAVSLYFRKEGVEVSNTLSFAQFIEHHEYASDTCRSSTLHRNQLDWLTDENGSIGVDHVFRIENIEQELGKIHELSGGRVILAGQKRANKNAASQSGAYRDMYDDRLRRLIAQRFEKDIDQFKYVF